MSADTTYSLAELADLAGVTGRTIRYYTAQGLLPSPAQVGPATRYPEAHLARLRLIKQLQRGHLPLAEIRGELAGLDDADVLTLMAMPSPPRLAESAVDYIRGVLAGSAGHSPGAGTSTASTSTPAPAAPAGRAAQAPPPPDTMQPDRSQWDRVLLAPDIELHVRRPLGRLQNRRVERLIAIARELLEEDRP